MQRALFFPQHPPTLAQQEARRRLAHHLRSLKLCRDVFLEDLAAVAAFTSTYTAVSRLDCEFEGSTRFTCKPYGHQVHVPARASSQRTTAGSLHSSPGMLAIPRTLAQGLC